VKRTLAHRTNALLLAFRIALPAALLLWGRCPALSQDDSPTFQLPDVPQLYFDLLCFAADQSKESRLDVYVEVPYEDLHFARDNDVFYSSYDVTVDVNDSLNKLVTEKIWTEKVETKEYDESISPHAGNLSQKSFLLPPGTYEVTVQVSDNDTKKTTRGRRKLTVRDFAAPPVCMSDIMLVNRLATDKEKKVVYPNISANVANLSAGFYVFFELYNRLGADSARIIMNTLNARGDTVQRDTSTQALGAERKPLFVKIDGSRLGAGEYTLGADAAPFGLKGGTAVPPVHAAALRAFTVHWRGVPVSITDLDLAIDELQYITDKDKIDEMKKAPAADKRELFREFWKKKDPTPNTERNELMEEYYNRVAYANKHFSHYVDGWKTDMGMVHIIFGPPSNIERHPFDIDSKPYEVWTYYDLNREFIFVDATGFGDYRLQTPIWDVWRTRPR
jgi:GWxTD domain-containing protein